MLRPVVVVKAEICLVLEAPRTALCSWTQDKLVHYISQLNSGLVWIVRGNVLVHAVSVEHRQGLGAVNVLNIHSATNLSSFHAIWRVWL